MQSNCYRQTSDVIEAKNLKAKAEASTFKTKVWTFEVKDKVIGPEAKAFKLTARAEIEIRSTTYI